MYIGIEEWGNRRGRVGEGRERDMKGGRGSMKAGGLFGLTWPRNHETTSVHALRMTRGSQMRSYSPRK
jgi:hypothetical protein